MFMQTPVQIIGLIATIIVCGLALWRGPSRARKVALGACIAFAATPLVQDWHNWSGVQLGIMTADVVFLLFLISLIANRMETWLRIVIGAQTATVLSHLTMAINEDILTRAYAGTTYALWFVLLTGLSWGVWRRDTPNPIPPDAGGAASARRYLRSFL